MLKRLFLSVSLALVGGAGAATIAIAQTSSQRFFERQLLNDRQTSSAVKGVLRSDGGFINPRIAFTDLTGDRRDDAVVLVSSGGAAGDVALFVFSTAGPRGVSGRLRPVFRSQSLFRASVRVRNGVLTERAPRFAPTDDLCCPATIVERDLRWNRATGTFRVVGTRDVRPAG